MRGLPAGEGGVGLGGMLLGGMWTRGPARYWEFLSLSGWVPGCDFQRACGAWLKEEECRVMQGSTGNSIIRGISILCDSSRYL